MAKCDYSIEGKKINDKGIAPALCTYERMKPCPYGSQKTDSMTMPAHNGARYPLCFSKGMVPDGLEKKTDAVQSPEQKQKKAEREEVIFKNYTECTKKLNELFGLLYDEVCKSCIEVQVGHGCCYGTGVEEVYNDKINEVRKQVLEKAIADGKETGFFCTYHDDKTGCLIPDLKSPKCIAHWCPSEKVEEKYGIKYDISRVREDLELVLADTRLENGEWKYDGFDPQSVSSLKSYIQSMIDSVKKVKSGERK